jgi:hypothetical protein
MNDFERGFLEELEKISAAENTMPSGSTIPKPKTMASLTGQSGVTGYKGIATAIRSPLSLSTPIKPPTQTFYTGQ